MHTAMHGYLLSLRDDAGPLMAHPDSALVGEPEAALVINTVRTLLTYLEGKQREADRSSPLAAEAF